MFDFDPRDCDSRDNEHFDVERHRGGRGSSDDDRDDDWRQPDFRQSDQDDDARTLGRGPGDSRGSHSDEHARDRRHDARWPERDRHHRERHMDPRTSPAAAGDATSGSPTELGQIPLAPACMDG